MTRCSSSLTGHGQPVVSALFSPNGARLASGSGDKTVRFWDLTTETPQHVCSGHADYVLALSWSPDGKMLASGDKSGQVRIWCPRTGKQKGKVLMGHRQWITSLSWEPLHLAKSGLCRRLVSCDNQPIRTRFIFQQLMTGEQQQGWRCESVGHYDWPMSEEHDWSHSQCDMCEVSDIMVVWWPVILSLWQVGRLGSDLLWQSGQDSQGVAG